MRCRINESDNHVYGCLGQTKRVELIEYSHGCRLNSSTTKELLDFVLLYLDVYNYTT